MMVRVDPIDIKMIELLQSNGRMSLTEIAQTVGLSTSACSRRLADLHRRSVITGYRALVDPRAIGRDVEVLAFITMGQEDAETIDRFEQLVSELPEVSDAERLFGDPDYLIRVATDSVEAYQTIRDTQLAALPGVQKVTSTLVMRRVVANRPLAPKSASADGSGIR